MKDENKGRETRGVNRRDFLKTTALAGAGVLFAPAVMTKAAYNNSDDLNVALLGTGAQGQVLMNACLKLPNLRFKAVCDIWAEYNSRRASGLLKKYGHDLNVYMDFREMLAKEKDLDAVIVATPDFWHAPHAEGCLNAGVNVYLEKEMSNTLEGARRIVDAVKRTGKILQVGHQRRSNPRYLFTYQKLIEEAKLLGRITTIHGQWNRAVQPDNGWPKGREIPYSRLRQYGFDNMHQFRNWRWYKGLGGGPIVDLGSHQIDIFNWFLKSVPRAVSASGGTDYYEKATHEWYDSVLATYEYDTPEGVVRAFYQTITTNSYGGYYETFMGDEASLVISESASRGGLYREPAAPQWEKWVKSGIVNPPAEEEPKPQNNAVLDVRETLAPPKYDIPVTFNDPYHMPHLLNFFDTIRGRAELNCPVEIGYETAVTVLKVNEAVRAQRRITFNHNEFFV